MLRIGTTVLGVDDIPRAIEFWRAALRYELRDAPGDSFAVLVPADQQGPHLALTLSDSPVPAVPRVHLDLYADDQAAEVDRLLALGASRVDWKLYPADPDFVVLADPDGNRFCVIDNSG
jgi:catechol 2,3-dioxygenase-like lactoylglutathione lyase family enzyme